MRRLYFINCRRLQHIKLQRLQNINLRRSQYINRRQLQYINRRRLQYINRRQLQCINRRRLQCISRRRARRAPVPRRRSRAAAWRGAHPRGGATRRGLSESRRRRGPSESLGLLICVSRSAPFVRAWSRRIKTRGSQSRNDHQSRAAGRGPELVYHRPRPEHAIYPPPPLSVPPCRRGRSRRRRAA